MPEVIAGRKLGPWSISGEQGGVQIELTLLTPIEACKVVEVKTRWGSKAVVKTPLRETRFFSSARHAIAYLRRRGIAPPALLLEAI